MSCDFKRTERPFLYFMVFICWFNSCEQSTKKDIGRLEQKIDSLKIIINKQIIK